MVLTIRAPARGLFQSAGRKLRSRRKTPYRVRAAGYPSGIAVKFSYLLQDWNQRLAVEIRYAQLVVLSAGGKGVTVRKAADVFLIKAHVHRPGFKPRRKKMTLVGTVYAIAVYNIEHRSQICRFLRRAVRVES